MDKKVSEAWVKQEIKKILKAKGVWYFMPAMNGFGRAGIPDFICCVSGTLLGIEAKAGSNRATEMQKAELEAIKLAGGVAIVINEKSLRVLSDLVDSLHSIGEANHADRQHPSE